MISVLVTLEGCDAGTHIDLDVTPEELAFLKKLSDISYEDGGGCAPTLSVREI